MKTYNDVEIDGSFEISLSKLAGCGIKDVTGYISREFDEPVFKLCNIILEDGTKLGCEGEHDMPYLVNYSDKLYEDIENVYRTDPDYEGDYE